MATSSLSNSADDKLHTEHTETAVAEKSSPSGSALAFSLADEKKLLRKIDWKVWRGSLLYSAR
jgi:hypothetical protein